MKVYLLFSLCLGLQLLAKPVEPSDAKALGKQLMSNLQGIFSLDSQNTEKLGPYLVPHLLNGNWVIRSKPVALVDSFSEETGAIATLFVKVGDEFVRLTTTEEGESPGTALVHSHPAYKNLLGELRYTNKVTLANKDYMADYDVFRDRQGRVIGAYLVGILLKEQSGEQSSK